MNALPAEEYRDIMEYYKEYFEEAGEENEEKVANELGDANELAERIIKENMSESVAENSATLRLYSSSRKSKMGLARQMYDGAIM